MPKWISVEEAAAKYGINFLQNMRKTLVFVGWEGCVLA